MTTNMTDIDAYIASFPTHTQDLLNQLRSTLNQAAPDAEETINYGMPTLTLNGNLVHFAAFKQHIGFYPAPTGIEAFKSELAGYKGAKGSIQFPIDKPLPLDLIAKITRFRVTENLERAARKAIQKSSAKPKKRSDQEQVTEHIQQLDPEIGLLVEALRQVILSTDPEIGERIKWNNPSYYYTGDMKPFDPKEYKRELVVFNLHKGRVMLVFPSGANVNDSTGFLEGDYKDGRRTVIFKDMDDIRSKETQLQHVIKEWLKLVER
ncbi:hypothetical protein EXU85_11875 [Spirosoma sp. KCTC 42546]|uniref:DUF1801 domain-containing protein n=1 Tax=Spirosoma sp. KCTC 42546 TaxID=2520506 RepID=UPI00115BD7EB|nr:hypothetical protein EXU85_11875 [Spirosoma sp. KCTC 42546]